ncbi:hypothetical protein FRC19_001810 [Serendipita sp. 401]|nr:hypothetical protein FRC19_001810 [Serendipita sp. 401]KAG9043390.1 hypothetical protein FS842_001829 [Serendipita sp. 407]
MSPRWSHRGVTPLDPSDTSDTSSNEEEVSEKMILSDMEEESENGEKKEWEEEEEEEQPLKGDNKKLNEAVSLASATISSPSINKEKPLYEPSVYIEESSDEDEEDAAR